MTGFLFKSIVSQCCLYFSRLLQFFCGSEEARGIKALKKQMVWPKNDGLLGFLFKSNVLLWASNGLLFEARAAFIFQVYSNSIVKARPEARGIKVTP